MNIQMFKISCSSSLTRTTSSLHVSNPKKIRPCRTKPKDNCLGGKLTILEYRQLHTQAPRQAKTQLFG